MLEYPVGNFDDVSVKYTPIKPKTPRECEAFLRFVVPEASNF